MKQVVVIGAGPAGASAAYFLSALGFEVLVVEKQQFPRNKTCGGGVTPKVLQELHFSLETVIEKTIKQTILTNNNNLPITITREHPMVYMVERAKFDQFLLDKAVETGAKLKYGKVIKIVSVNDGYEVQLADGTVIAADYIIGADGAQGVSYKHVNYRNNRELAVTVEAEIPNYHDLSSILVDYGIHLLE